MLRIQAFVATGNLSAIVTSGSSYLPMVCKGSNDWRPCEDYRRLNAIYHLTDIPIPPIHDFSMRLDGCNIFSKIDLVRACHISMAEEDIQNTALKVPFALLISQTFKMFINQFFCEMEFVFVYTSGSISMTYSSRVQPK